MTGLDRGWLGAHPLPGLEKETDKNARGRVLAAGGSNSVPGGLLLTGEAALRAGAGKVQFATVEGAALPLGIAMPEAAVFGLPANAEGELAAGAAGPLVQLLGLCDALVLGPGMGKEAGVGPILRHVLAAGPANLPIVIDAAAIGAARGCVDAVRARGGKIVLTPHAGEMALLMDCDEAELRDRPEALARAAAERFAAVVVLKQAETLIVAPEGTSLRYPGGGPGLATAGSGDVLAGILAGLLARGATPLLAAAWAVWLHGEAGRRLAARAPVGFMARELPARIPELMAEPGESEPIRL